MSTSEVSRATQVDPARDGVRASIALGEGPLSIDEFVAVSSGAASLELSGEAIERMQRSRRVFEKIHAGGDGIYGVTTSVGASVETQVPKHLAAELSQNLIRMHGVGTGRILDEDEAAGVIVARLSSLCAGVSAVRPVVAETLAALVKHRALPRIPAEGSVGASGDLTPMSYVAAVLIGERQVTKGGRVVDSAEALRECGLTPLVLGSKEALALLNGTAVATALACLAWHRARRLARLSATLTAMASRAVLGNSVHFDAFLHQAKPHPGQILVASWIRGDLGDPPNAAERLQDRYSLRCAPHVIGVLVDALDWSKSGLETELNGVSDNPVVDTENERIVHGGNFYGGHVGFFCDALKTATASVACLLDRQLMLLCNPAENAGLPADLVGAEGDNRCVHNGFKAMTISASALSAEALKLTMPATAFSRSTELHNQDKVPMATLAARDLLRVVELCEQVAAIVTLACCQALDLRDASDEGAPAHKLRDTVRALVPRLQADRAMDGDIHHVLALLRNDELLPRNGD